MLGLCVIVIVAESWDMGGYGWVMFRFVPVVLAYTHHATDYCVVERVPRRLSLLYPAIS